MIRLLFYANSLQLGRRRLVVVSQYVGAQCVCDGVEDGEDPRGDPRVAPTVPRAPTKAGQDHNEADAVEHGGDQSVVVLLKTRTD